MHARASRADLDLEIRGFARRAVIDAGDRHNLDLLHYRPGADKLGSAIVA